MVRLVFFFFFLLLLALLRRNAGLFILEIRSLAWEPLCFQANVLFFCFFFLVRLATDSFPQPKEHWEGECKPATICTSGQISNGVIVLQHWLCFVAIKPDFKMYCICWSQTPAKPKCSQRKWCQVPGPVSWPGSASELTGSLETWYQGASWAKIEPVSSEAAWKQFLLFRAKDRQHF